MIDKFLQKFNGISHNNSWLKLIAQWQLCNSRCDCKFICYRSGTAPRLIYSELTHKLKTVNSATPRNTKHGTLNPEHETQNPSTPIA
jgi:hypothetical protein